MTKALESFARTGIGNKLVILGDMRELGEHSRDAHNEIIQLCSTLKLDGIYVGDDFKKASNETDLVFESVELLVEYLVLNKVSSKSILLKGSRGMEMERLLPLL
jgi:UDP-N-acetylmuramoyl-tripeptide--D-alanyl-D-alanine ligase